jgi:imidazolonepropionase
MSHKRTLITHIGQLCGILNQHTDQPICGLEMSKERAIENAFLYIEQGIIHSYGPMHLLPENGFGAEVETIYAQGKIVMPGFVDAHTHIVYAKSREEEFVDKLNGLSYADIAAKGGGILNSARKLQNCSAEELYDSAMQRLEQMKSLGTCAVEIKSGYGLTVEAELKMLRVVRKIKETAGIPIKATFLGAHAVPAYVNNRTEYVQLVINEMLPRVAGEGLADYCDVFCETGFFTPDETLQILEAGLKYGLKPKVHANELDYSGGVQVGTQLGAVSVDHLECCGEEELNALTQSNTIPVLLPGTAFYMGLPHPPVRKMINKNLPVAISSDFNPGTCPSGNMPQMWSFACILYKMLPWEALSAATQNAAAAIELSATHGSISKGKKASVIITKKVPSLAYLPYSFGENWIDRVII